MYRETREVKGVGVPTKRRVRVVPLTPQLCSKMKAEAAAALNGDGTCSLKAMSMSCFASEACSKNTVSNMTLDLLMQHDLRFVAVDEDSDEFIGCVSAQRRASDKMSTHYFPYEDIPPSCLILYNLCVSHEYRGCGAGRKLVQAVLDSAPTPSSVYLLVSKLNPNETDERKRKVYTDRVDRLLATYSNLDFKVVCQCTECFLLKHN